MTLCFKKYALIGLCFIVSQPSFANAPAKITTEKTSGAVPVLDAIEKKDDKTLSWKFLYIADLGRNFAGGKKVGGSYMGVASLQLFFDVERAIGWKDADFFLNVQGLHGTVPSHITGDAQIASNIESYVDTVTIMEAWFKQTIINKSSFLLFGLLDLNSEFYLTNSSLLFVNSSFGLGTELAQINPSGKTASTFPVTSLAFLFKYHLTKKVYFDLGVFDATPGDPRDGSGTKVIYQNDKEGHLFISEMGRHSARSKYAVGAWTYDRAFKHQIKQRPDGSPANTRNYGFYAIGEKMIAEDIWAFLRYGKASETANRFKDNLAIGVSAIGLIPHREEDKIGFGITTVTNGSDYREKKSLQGERTQTGETVYELTYRYVYNDFFNIQPDLQYIEDPNTDPDLDDAWVGFLRFHFEVD